MAVNSVLMMALRSGAMLAHEENSNVPLILYGVPGTSAVLAMPG